MHVWHLGQRYIAILAWQIAHGGRPEDLDSLSADISMVLFVCVVVGIYLIMVVLNGYDIQYITLSMENEIV